MRHLLNATRLAIRTENWDAALVTALCLPDIAGGIDEPTLQGPRKARERYTKWAQTWLNEPFSVLDLPGDVQAQVAQLEERIELLRGGDFDANRGERAKHIADLLALTSLSNRVLVPWIGSGDLFALRCAFCHNGEHDLEGHGAKEVLDRFTISSPKPGSTIHMNRNGKTLQIQVDIFCETICGAVEAWLDARKGDERVNRELSQMPKILPAF